MSVQSFHLSELEEKARANALKRVSDNFQKPEQLDKIDLIKSRFLNQKTATEAQLKMALYSQLDGSKVGLEKLDAALEESHTCRNRMQELEGIRDELMYEVFRQKSMEDLDTLRAFFRELEDLNEMFRHKIIMLGSRLTSAVITHNRFVVNCVRVIDREER
ncbi:unnamed protein product [Trichobilharzia regenti]|nr:unnamed protein product [Trichobilharzia regenti]